MLIARPVRLLTILLLVLLATTTFTAALPAGAPQAQPLAESAKPPAKYMPDPLAEAFSRRPKRESAASAADTNSIELLSHIGGRNHGFAVQGDYAYVGEGPALAVLNVSNPANPVVLGKTAVLPGLISAVAVAKDYAYVAAGAAGLRIINVANPAVPTEVGYYDTPGSARGVAVAGNYAYVADNYAGLRIINVANPAAPTEVGFYDTPGSARGVFMASSYAYVADGDAGLRIINVANPAAPTEVGFYVTGGSASGVVVAGSYAYVADEYTGLRIINVANPAVPTEVGFYVTGGFATGVTVAGSYAYVADWGAGLRIINVANPAVPTEVGYYDTPALTLGVVVAGSYAYVTDNDASLRIINVANPAVPTEVGYYNTLEYANDVVVAGSYAYVTDSGAGLRIINVANPAAPTEVGFYDTPGSANAVFMASSYAYVADGDAGLRIINVANPAAPTEVGFYDTPGSANAVFMASSYAYVADGDAGLRIINVANPVALTEVGFYDTPGTAFGVAVAGYYAYVADGDNGGLRIIDIADPVAPTEVGFYNTPGMARGVAVAGDYAYVADWYAGLRILNIANPVAPSEASFYDTAGQTGSVAVAGDYAYVADNEGGLIILRYTGDLPTYSVSGQVTDGNNNPIIGVNVSVTGSDSATTDEGGSYTITGLTAGTYTLLADKVGYTFTPALRTVTLPPDAIERNFYALALPAVIDPKKSTITADPPFAEADGVDSSQVTITLKNAAGAPIPGKEVQLVSDRGPEDAIIQPAGSTNASGQVTAVVQSLTEGKATLWAWVPADGLRIETSANITFGETEPVPDEIQRRSGVIVGMANRHLDQMWNNSQAVADEAIYFRGALGENAFKLAAGLFGGIIDTYSGLSDWQGGELAARNTFPGWERLLSSPAWASPFACKISNAFLKDASSEIDNEVQRRRLTIALRGGLYLLTAQKDNQCLGELTKDILIDDWHILNLLKAHLDQPDPEQRPISRKIDESKEFLLSEQQRINTVRIPALTPSETDAYLNDLGSRGSALPLFSNRLQDARWTLEAVHQANETDPIGGHTTQLLLRLGAQYGAEYLFDGAGRAVVKDSLALFDAYMDTNALFESSEMGFLASSTILKTAPETVQQVTDTIGGGLEQIVLGQEPLAPQGNIQKVEHFSDGSYLGPLWREKESYSLITVKNTGDTTTNFHVVVRYLAQTTRLTVPWAALWLDKSSDPVPLEPGEVRTLRVVYKDNSTGYSPSEDGYGLSASDIKVDLLAVNEASYFHLDHDTSLWDPSRTTSSSVGMVMLDKASASTAITIDEPIVTAVESGLGRSFQTGYIWVNNPLAVTVPVTVTQPLVPEFTLLDPGSGVQESNSVVWGDHIDPLDTIMFTYTFVTGDFPGTDLMLPAAELIIQNPSGGNISVTSDPVPFSLPWPITISRKTPEWIPPETAATITVTATNQMDENVSGSFRVDVETSEGISVQSTTQPLALSAKQSQSLTFDLPATLDIGDYLFTGSLQVQGEHTVVFKDPFSVGARSPYLATTISPVAPDGTVEAGATLTCEVLVENSASIKLTNVVVSSSIPAGVDLISMSSGGISVNNRIQWDNQEVLPGASKTYTFVIHIPEHFVMKGEEHYIHSVPTLTSNESPDTTGFAATVVVIDNQKRKVYLPVTVDSPIAP